MGGGVGLSGWRRAAATCRPQAFQPPAVWWQLQRRPGLSLRRPGRGAPCHHARARAVERYMLWAPHHTSSATHVHVCTWRRLASRNATCQPAGLRDLAWHGSRSGALPQRLGPSQAIPGQASLPAPTACSRQCRVAWAARHRAAHARSQASAKRSATLCPRGLLAVGTAGCTCGWLRCTAGRSSAS